MRVLLDTHAFLWFILDDARLSPNAAKAISDPVNVVEISPAVYWELAVKISVGKYKLNEPYQSFVEGEIAANRFHVLPIEPRHTAALIGLPFHHRDPFDRLLVAQAISERIAVVSADSMLDSYGVSRIW